jgi:hypothetical protein
LLGVSEKQAEKFSKEWYNLKRQETSALWEQQQDIRKGDEISMRKLREQVAEAVQAKRARKVNPRTNQKYLKCPETTREFSGAREKTQAWSFHYSVCNRRRSKRRRKGISKRELAIEKLNRTNRKMGRKARHQMTAELEKAERKAVKIVRNSKQKEARKWEAKGKSTMIKWLSSSISKRGDRKENPDRDKDGS